MNSKYGYFWGNFQKQRNEKQMNKNELILKQL